MCLVGWAGRLQCCQLRRAYLIERCRPCVSGWVLVRLWRNAVYPSFSRWPRRFLALREQPMGNIYRNQVLQCVFLAHMVVPALEAQALLARQFPARKNELKWRTWLALRAIGFWKVVG